MAPGEAEIPTTGIVFWFSDVEDSTPLWEADPERMHAALALHDRLLADACAGGRIFKTVGDGVCATFPSVDSAVAAAIRATASLTVADWPLPAPLRVRIAIGRGAAYPRDGDWFGPTVNRVARLRDAAWGGQVLLSAEAAAECSAPLRDLGAVYLRGVADPTRLYQLGDADFPPPRTAAHHPGSLPEPLDELVGREVDLEQLAALLKPRRLVTLVGPGGGGKTRLALAVAAEVRQRFTDGVWWAELAGIRDGSALEALLAGVVGLTERPDRDWLAQLTGWLAPRNTLLILDNAEQVVDATAGLARELLRAAPRLRVLVTSREPLALAEEATYPVGPLGWPTSPVAPAEALTYPAVALFARRCQGVDPSFAVTPENVGETVDLCRRLDGLPLALELAAARSASLTPGDMLRRLDHRFRLLARPRGPTPRHLSLQAAIDWGWDLLAPPTRRMFARLSLLRGSFDAAAAAAVGADGDDLLADDELAELRSKSFLGVEPGPRRRFRQLDTLRAYGAERLIEGGEEVDAARALVSCFRARAEELEPRLQGPEQAAALAEAAADQDNYRAALAWAERLGDAASALATARGLWRFWYQRGFLTEGLGYLERALAAVGGMEPRALSAAHNAAGNLALRLHRADDAEAHHRRALELRRDIGDDALCASSLNNLGLLASERGDHARAEAYLAEAMDRYRAAGNAFGEASVLLNLAAEATDREAWPDAARWLDRAEEPVRRHADPAMLAAWCYNLGLTRLELLGPDAALPALLDSRRLYESVGNNTGLASTLDALAEVYRRRGDQPGADAASAEADRLCQSLEDPPRRRRREVP